uniref:Carbonic anhydrase n=1 Tax=Naja naja TaxID=35670 RepID=A0A8C6XT52_NAJNA
YPDRPQDLADQAPLFLLVQAFSIFLTPPPNISRPLRQVNGSEAPEGSSSLSDMTEWASMFPDCEGHLQSPININTTAVSFSTKLEPLLLSGYDLPPKETLPLKNNGHTVLLGLPKKMTLGGGGFPQPYQAAQLHLHWGSGHTRPGSEHTVDGHRYAGEIHVVHYSSHFESIQEAATEPGGLAVLAAFLALLHGSPPCVSLHPPSMILTEVSCFLGEDTVVAGFDIAKLLPYDLGRYFRYNGSLTTPPCYQTVNWTVFNQTVRLSQEQISVLEETLQGDDEEPIQNNFRLLQGLYGRTVLSSFHNGTALFPLWGCPGPPPQLDFHLWKFRQNPPSGFSIFLYLKVNFQGVEMNLPFLLALI